ncbi:hypothetical protein DUI87_00519 [Hirundo rustica rustica]|uniref:Uncharacterized protein n=1 Tax=Hirundo rustica rustica TaxID=333673 RepID=A0A3M0L9Z1_HIRRU|nr:hypothetical protein DUI87_00519 [Hirundo rustica rustica]
MSMPSVSAVSAIALWSAIALPEFSVHSMDAVLTSGFSCILIGLASVSVVPSVALVVVFLCRMRRNIRTICSRMKGRKSGMFRGELQAGCLAKQWQQAQPRLTNVSIDDPMPVLLGVTLEGTLISDTVNALLDITWEDMSIDDPKPDLPGVTLEGMLVSDTLSILPDITWEDISIDDPKPDLAGGTLEGMLVSNTLSLVPDITWEDISIDDPKPDLPGGTLEGISVLDAV